MLNNMSPTAVVARAPPVAVVVGVVEARVTKNDRAASSRGQRARRISSVD
jgi:hypothetical protein